MCLDLCKLNIYPSFTLSLQVVLSWGIRILFNEITHFIDPQVVERMEPKHMHRYVLDFGFRSLALLDRALCLS